VRIFCLGTGRSGTSSFYQAAKSLHGFTAGHESRAGIVHDWTFPDQHVEVASQLVYGIPLLLRRYPDARWVHLVREREACVFSLQRQCWESMTSFAQQWFLVDHPADVAKAAGEFYDRTNDLIEALCPPELTMRIRTEELAERWPEFCEWIGADYDRELAAEALSHRYNPGVLRGRDNYI
jgi:hypothetical protein